MTISDWAFRCIARWYTAILRGDILLWLSSQLPKKYLLRGRSLPGATIHSRIKNRAKTHEFPIHCTNRRRSLRLHSTISTTTKKWRSWKKNIAQLLPQSNNTKKNLTLSLNHQGKTCYPIGRMDWWRWEVGSLSTPSPNRENKIIRTGKQADIKTVDIFILLPFLTTQPSLNLNGSSASDPAENIFNNFLK